MFSISAPNTAQVKTYPSPIGGLNARDSLAAMPPEDAVILTNWWVRPSTCAVRKGALAWATGFASPVETLMEWESTTGATKLFAASGASVYNVTNAGVIGAAEFAGQSNARWQSTCITTPAGTYLYAVNGADAAITYNGTAWNFITSVSTPAITNVATNSLVNICLFKNRLWFTEINSTRVWYLPVASIGGAATSIDMGSLFTRGGYLVGMWSWTIDAGAGVDDLAVFISSNGEVAVYAGTDPATAATWGLIGLFYLGRPLGRRCAVKFGGDLMVICEQGVYPLGKGLLSSSIDKRVAVTDKIQRLISVDVVSYRANFGWTLCLYPQEGMLILNVPAGSGMNRQYAQNTITQAWTTFTGWDARCWLNALSGLYFGDGNSVNLAWTGNVDGANVIKFDALTSFQYFDKPTQNKYFNMIRPYFSSTGTPSISFDINGNFLPVDPKGVYTYTAPTGMIWGSMNWGSMVWGGSLQTLLRWSTVGGVYASAAIRLKGQNNGAELEWAATDLVYQVGGVL